MPSPDRITQNTTYPKDKDKEALFNVAHLKQTTFIKIFYGRFRGSGSTRPEIKSAPESSRPWVNSACSIKFQLAVQKGKLNTRDAFHTKNSK